MAEMPAATPHLASPASVGAAFLESGRALGESPLRPQASPELMGRVAARALLRPNRKRSGFCDRGRRVRRRRDGDKSSRRFGDSLLAGNSVNCGTSEYDCIHELSYINSYENSISSSDKENVIPKRKWILEDALFGFFRKEAVKSLKRDFTNFCNDSVIFTKNKRLKEHTISRDSFISYSIKYFCEVLKSMTQHQKEVILKFGFGCLLLLGKCDIPSALVRWIAHRVDSVSQRIIIDDKVISFSKDSVHHVTGLPNYGSVPMPDSEGGAKFLLAMFGLTELPHITYFGNKLKSKEVLTDKEIFVCFMVVAFKCFLFPTMDQFPNTDFISILQEPESASGVDFCLLVFEHLIAGVWNYINTCKRNGRKSKDFEFCYYILAVYYLDSLDFGARTVDQTVPRITIWKGNLIKFFSDLDHRKNNLFGKRQLKKNLPPCYNEFGLLGTCTDRNDVSNNSFEPSCFCTAFKNDLHTRFGSALDAKLIDGIIGSVESAVVTKLENASKSELCVRNVLEFLLELKSSIPKACIFGDCIKHCQEAKPHCTASPRDNINSGSEANTNIASKLDSINQRDFSLALSSSALANNNTETSQACPMTEVVEQCNIFNTAPAMHPIRKVKSRLPHSLPENQVLLSSKTHSVGGKESKAFLMADSSNGKQDARQSVSFGGFVVDNYMMSPISKINFSQSLIEKNVSSFIMSHQGTVNNRGSRSNSVSGSKQAPIPIPEASPKPQHTSKSPEVQIIVSRNFSERQVELAEKSDELYNSLLSNCGHRAVQKTASKENFIGKDEEYVDLSQHAAEKRLSKDDLVILQPKNTLVFPLAQNRRFPVSNLDVKNFCAIVELAYTRGVQKSYSVMFSKVHCTYITLEQSLQQGGHVDNFLIPVFCRKLFEDNHPSKSGKHHFFSIIGESILDYNNEVQLSLVSKAFLGAASASKGKRLDLSDRLFFPICRSRHWFTFCVDFKYKMFIFLDSLFNKEDDFHTKIKKVLINNFVKL